MIVKIKNFSNIDFIEIDPDNDEFLLENGEVYTFTPLVCHHCWEGGTVLNEKNKEKLYCLRCCENLKWVSLCFQTSDEAKPEPEKFLLPDSWNEDAIKIWLEKFKEKRELEIKVRENMINSAEGGDYL